MAAATTIPSPHSSHSSQHSSPHSSSVPLAPPTNAATYSQEDVLRFVQAALAAAYREQLGYPHGRPALVHQALSGNQQQSLQQERIMKPRVHMYESYGPPRMMVATLELPGLQKEDVAITARPNGELFIAGERRPQHLQFLQSMQTPHMQDDERVVDGEQDSRGRTHFNELKFGKFQRVIRLPEGTDPTQITASMDDGMLTICWPLPIPGPVPPVKHEDNGNEAMEDEETISDLKRPNPDK